MKKTNTLSLFLGLMSLAFGLLKFIDPFKSWYATQIETSGLPGPAYVAGIAGEIIIGLLYMVSLSVLAAGSRRLLLVAANGGLILMMATAIYVHLLPAVPAEVLPLKIKPPVIPVAVMLLAFVNHWLNMKEAQATE